MKRLMLVWVMILCLVPLGAWAEEETSEPLFPAMGENEKWGYINRSGEFVIAPQFDYAQEFRGNYAVVITMHRIITQTAIRRFIRAQLLPYVTPAETLLPSIKRRNFVYCSRVSCFYWFRTLT